MSYSISISGHGADAELVKRVTTEAVRQLREPEGATAGATASGSGPDGQSFSVSISSADPLDDEPAGEDDGSTAEPEGTS